MEDKPVSNFQPQGAGGTVSDLVSNIGNKDNSNHQSNNLNSDPSVTTQETSSKGKSKLKYFIFVIVLLLIMILTPFVVSIPTLNKLSGCINVYSTEIDRSDQLKAKQNWTKEQFCMNDKALVINYAACVEETNERSFIPVGFVNFIGGIINPSVDNVTKEKVTKLHNDFCTDYPDSLIWWD